MVCEARATRLWASVGREGYTKLRCYRDLLVYMDRRGGAFALSSYGLFAGGFLFFVAALLSLSSSAPLFLLPFFAAAAAAAVLASPVVPLLRSRTSSRH